jgi:DNA mismatch repair protein MutS
VKFLKFEVQYINQRLIFTHVLQQGFTDHSFALEVCRSAGLSEAVLNEAHHHLNNSPKTLFQNSSQVAQNELQGLDSLKIEREILSLDPNNLTPMQALILLENLKNQITKKLSELNQKT